MIKKKETKKFKYVIKEVIKNYIEYNKWIKYLIIPVIVITIANAFLEVYKGKLFKQMAENLEKNAFFIHFKNFIWLTLGLCISKVINTFILAYPCQMVYIQCMEETLRTFLELSFVNFHRIGVGKANSLLERRTIGTNELVKIFINKIFPTPFIFFFVAVTIVKDFGKLISVIVFLNITFFIFVTIILSNIRSQIKLELNKNINKTSNLEIEILSNYENIIIYNNIEYEINRYKKCTNQLIEPSVHLEYLTGLIKFAQMLILYLIDILVILSLYKENKFINVAAKFLQYRSIMDTVQRKITSLSEIYNNAVIFMTDILEFHYLPKKEEKGEIIFDKFTESISFKNVMVCHNQMVCLNNLSFDIRKNEKVALIGDNGAGKTTFIRTLVGFYDYKGSIKIDGLELRNVKKESLTELISYIPQDSSLINESVLSNISYGGNFSYEDIKKIASFYKMDEILVNEFVSDFSIGERGKYLSEGEKQKIAFLRAVIRNKPILIFDEPTSSIDTCSELKMFDRLLSTSSDKTLLVILHNLNFLEKFDKIILFSEKQCFVFNDYLEYSDWINKNK